MTENKEIPVVDFEEMVDWIELETEHDRDIIQHILEMETEYLKTLGVIIEDETPEK